MEWVFRGQAGAWSGLIIRCGEKGGREGENGFAWAEKTGRTWTGRGAENRGCVWGGCWLVLQTVRRSTGDRRSILKARLRSLKSIL